MTTDEQESQETLLPHRVGLHCYEKAGAYPGL